MPTKCLLHRQPQFVLIQLLFVWLSIKHTKYNVTIQIEGAYIEDVTSNYLPLISTSYIGHSARLLLTLQTASLLTTVLVLQKV